MLHDFSVPVFRLKQDAIPGRVITGWFKPTRPGEYDIQCAEICGIGHGMMGARIFIETPEEHAAWMSQSSAGKPAAPLRRMSRWLKQARSRHTRRARRTTQATATTSRAF